MPKLFAVSIILFLLLGAGYGAIQAARTIPWDCSDWQAYAHEGRTTAILESLAENRGKTLYCGVDQSDTFGEAETWAAGKGRNERDNTVYYGERGHFRGFIAAQEGWLPDGESGITGQSIATIFEFPKEERRIRRTKRITVGTNTDQFPIAVNSCGEVRGLICGNSGNSGNFNANNHEGPKDRARERSAGVTGTSTNWQINWQTQAITRTYGSGNSQARPSAAQWTEMAVAAAERACRARGARYIAGSADFGPGHSNEKGSGANDSGDNPGWFVQRTAVSATAHYYTARQSRTWTGKCIKKVRRN